MDPPPSRLPAKAYGLSIKYSSVFPWGDDLVGKMAPVREENGHHVGVNGFVRSEDTLLKTYNVPKIISKTRIGVKMGRTLRYKLHEIKSESLES